MAWAQAGGSAVLHAMAYAAAHEAHLDQGAP